MAFRYYTIGDGRSAPEMADIPSAKWGQGITVPVYQMHQLVRSAVMARLARLVLPGIRYHVTQQDDIARTSAQRAATRLDQLTSDIVIDQLIVQPGLWNGCEEMSWHDRHKVRFDEARAATGAVRDLVIAHASRAETLLELDHQGISGRDWVDNARQEQDVSVLCLRAAPC